MTCAAAVPEAAPHDTTKAQPVGREYAQDAGGQQPDDRRLLLHQQQHDGVGGGEDGGCKSGQHRRRLVIAPRHSLRPAR